MPPTNPPRAELFVRSLSPPAGRRPARMQLSRLRRLDEAGALDLSVSVWGREVALSTTAARTDAGQSVLARVAEAREWADDRGVCVDPFFETREVTSTLTGEAYTALVLPVACLLEYREDELRHVAPYTTDSAVHSVADRVRILGESAAVADPGEAGPLPADSDDGQPVPTDSDSERPIPTDRDDREPVPADSDGHPVSATTADLFRQ
ncbi:hypothetical protein BRC95_08700 [Halobacteriales archaeon QS_5_68_33]|nr:MAG: hypothetical protein BRC95_08700 [Halobacteriales archaeon QS_5_68_33]